MTAPNLSLLDYELLALILAVLYLISSFEYVTLTVNKKYQPEPGKRSDYKKASTWAMAGIISSLVLGIIAASDVKVNWEIGGIPLPILSIVLWVFTTGQFFKLL